MLNDEAVPASGNAPRKTHAPDRILNAAVTLFAEHGFHGTTTASIARAAGVTEATLFKYFPSKQRLLEELPVLLMERMLKPLLLTSLRRFQEAATQSEPETVIVEVFKDRLGLLLEQRELFLVLLELLLHHPGEIRQKALGQLDEIFRFADQFHANYVAGGCYRPVDAKTAAQTMLAMILGQSLLSIVFRQDGSDAVEKEEVQERARILGEVFLYGMVKKPT